MYAHIELTRVGDVHERVVGEVAVIEQVNVERAHALHVLVVRIRQVEVDHLVSERIQDAALLRVDDAVEFAQVETPEHVLGVDGASECAAHGQCRVNRRRVQCCHFGRAFEKWTFNIHQNL